MVEEELRHIHGLSCDNDGIGLVGACRGRGVSGLRWLKRLLTYEEVVRGARNLLMWENLYLFMRLEIGDSHI